MQCHFRVAYFKTQHNQSFFPSPSPTLENLQLLFCHVWRGVGLKAEKQSGLSLTWIPKVSPFHPTPSQCKKYGLTCAPRSGQTPLFHFLRLPSCRSNRGEANAGRLLNYERWAWVIPVIRSKEAGPMPHGSMILFCGCTLHLGLQMKFPAFAGKLPKRAWFYFILKMIWVQRS